MRSHCAEGSGHKASWNSTSESKREVVRSTYLVRLPRLAVIDRIARKQKICQMRLGQLSISVSDELEDVLGKNDEAGGRVLLCLCWWEGLLC